MQLKATYDEVVTNLSTCKLSEDELELLKHGLDIALQPRSVNKTDVFASFEMLHRVLTKEVKNKEVRPELKTKISHLARNHYDTYKPSQASLKKHGILKKLRRNEGIIIVKPDKGNGVIILDRNTYHNSLLKLISDVSKFSRSRGDETVKREGSLQRFLRNLKKQGVFDEGTYEQAYPIGSMPARLYGLSKMHKIKQSGEIPPFRPIVSSIGSCNYKLAKFLDKMLSPFICDHYSCKDTFSFVNEIHSSVIEANSFLVSYDIQSLFTNIPLEETIDIAVTILFEKKPNLKISKGDLKKLFRFATSETQFLFNGVYYEQKDGVAMGLPLAPILANLFLGHHEGHG